MTKRLRGFRGNCNSSQFNKYSRHVCTKLTSLPTADMLNEVGRLQVRPEFSRRQQRRLPPCPLVIALVPLKCSRRNLQIPHSVLYLGKTCLGALALSKTKQTGLIGCCVLSQNAGSKHMEINTTKNKVNETPCLPLSVQSNIIFPSTFSDVVDDSNIPWGKCLTF